MLAHPEEEMTAMAAMTTLGDTVDLEPDAWRRPHCLPPVGGGNLRTRVQPP
jgi:hypothetical protein